jgi:hypothetical protein
MDIEIFSPSGAKVYQTWFDNQSFAAGQQRTYTVSWTVPTNAAGGSYRVALGAFPPGWSGPRYNWVNSAATFSVTTPSGARLQLLGHAGGSLSVSGRGGAPRRGQPGIEL